jgi:hypothetical protein
MSESPFETLTALSDRLDNIPDRYRMILVDKDMLTALSTPCRFAETWRPIYHWKHWVPTHHPAVLRG